MARSRTTIHRLADALHASGCALFVLDERRSIVFWNDACARWTGAAADVMIGQPCVYRAPDAMEPDAGAALAAALCPPPECLAGERRRAWREALLAAGGRVSAWIEYLPLGHRDDESPPILAIIDTLSPPPAWGAPADATASGESRVRDERREQHETHETHASESLATPNAAITFPTIASPLAAEPTSAALHLELARFRSRLTRRFVPEQFLGADPRIVRARAQAALAARGGSSVLIVGPRGVGKEHLARAIHYARHGEAATLLSPPPWAPLACSMLGAELLWSTLQALVDQQQKQPAAAGHVGTLLLNEVDELPLEVQRPLADLLASGVLRMQVIGAGARSLMDLAREGAFDTRLACLLSTLQIDVPPLAERAGDLPLLCQSLVEQFNGEGPKQLAGVSPEALDLLAACPWPGNLDELTEVLRESHGRAEGSEIAPADLPKRLRLASEASVRPARATEPIQLESFLADVERELIGRALRRAKGNKSRAAGLLGLTRPRLYRRMAELGLGGGEAE